MWKVSWCAEACMNKIERQKMTCFLARLGPETRAFFSISLRPVIKCLHFSCHTLLRCLFLKQNQGQRLVCQRFPFLWALNQHDVCEISEEVLAVCDSACHLYIYSVRCKLSPPPLSLPGSRTAPPLSLSLSLSLSPLHALYLSLPLPLSLSNLLCCQNLLCIPVTSIAPWVILEDNYSYWDKTHSGG